MSRRTVAGLLALGLVAVLVTLAAREPVPFVTFRPGPTLNVLGEYDGKKIVKVTGHRTYPTTGGLRMVTVYPSGPDDKLNLIDVMAGWIDPDTAVLPRGAVYKPTETNQSAQQASALEMSSSQDNATAAALTALGISYRTELLVDDVEKDGASNGILKKGDVLLAIDGRTDPDPNALITMIRAIVPGTPVALTVRRNSTTQVFRVVTKPAAKDPKSSRIGIIPGVQLTYPFKVSIQLPSTIGGPSAGMMFALSIYDVLTPGSLTGGKMIAGSGEITPEGVVGPIGGIGQKLVGAQRDGARLFLVAQENCSEAARSHYDSSKMRLVKVHLLSDAIKAIDAWRADPTADLPRCTR